MVHFKTSTPWFFHNAAKMHAITKMFQSKDLARKETLYQKIPITVPFRDSSDDGQSASEGLLGDKEGHPVDKPRSFVRRYYAAFLAHVVLFLFYLGSLLYVYQEAKVKGAIRGPNLVFCE